MSETDPLHFLARLRELPKRHLAAKFVLSTALPVLLIVSVCGWFASSYLAREIADRANAEANLQADHALASLTQIEALSTEHLRSSLRVMREEAARLGPVSSGGYVRLGEEMVPDLKFGSQSQVGNYGVVDKVKTLTGANTTLFARRGDDFIRISTNVMTADNKRAVLTLLDREGQAIQLLRRGEAFYGIGQILGQQYVTAYEPMRNASGEVVGIWYAGVPVLSLAELGRAVEQARILQHGYVAIVDHNHRALFKSAGVGEELVRAQMEGRQQGWVSTSRTFAHWRYSVIAAYPQADIDSQLLVVRFTVLAIGVLAAALITYFQFLLVRSAVTRPIEGMRACAARMAEGDLSSSVDYQSDHEIGALADSLRAMCGRVKELVADVNALLAAALAGELTQRADITRHSGDYRKIVEGVNALLDAQAEHQNTRMELARREAEKQAQAAELAQRRAEYQASEVEKLVVTLDRIAQGDLQVQTEVSTTDQSLAEVRQSFVRINQALGTTVAAIQRLSADTNTLVQAALQGQLEKRADASRHSGDFRKIVEGMNATMDAIAGPLRQVTNALDQFAEGDFTARIVSEYSGEFNRLKTAVNTMAEAVQSVLVEIGTATETLAAASDQLGKLSRTMGSSADETSTQANVVSAGSEQVSRNIQTVATGAEEMGASIREIAHSSAEATRIAQNALALAQETNTTVARLGVSSNEIGQVTRVITAIARQTRLLALNATIESAHAGDAGKGFSVVAGEVKELARQTGDATDNISRQIEAIQNDTRGAVEAIGKITQVVRQVADLQATIASAVEEQSATTSEIARNLSEAAGGGVSITQNIAGVAVAARSTTEAAAETQRSAQSLQQMAARLKEAVSHFTYQERPQRKWSVAA